MLGKRECLLWWLIGVIKKKLSESRKNIVKSRKIFQSQKKRKYKIKIEKKISESRKIFQNQEIFCYKNLEFNDFEFNEPPS